MVHEMKLSHDPFLKIKNRTKTIEMRLNDEKRSLIAKGDTIEFTDIGNGEKIRCSVTDIYKYSDFEELYRNHGKVLLGYDESDSPKPSDMLRFYSAESIRQYGVVGIGIAVI